MKVLGCGGTLLKHIYKGDKVYILFVSEGVTGRYKINEINKSKKEIFKRENMARKAAKTGGFKIVDFLNLKNLSLNNYPHNYLTNIIINQLIGE